MTTSLLRMFYSTAHIGSTEEFLVPRDRDQASIVTQSDREAVARMTGRYAEPSFIEAKWSGNKLRHSDEQVLMNAFDNAIFGAQIQAAAGCSDRDMLGHDGPDLVDAMIFARLREEIARRRLELAAFVVSPRTIAMFDAASVDDKASPTAHQMFAGFYDSRLDTATSLRQDGHLSYFFGFPVVAAPHIRDDQVHAIAGRPPDHLGSMRASNIERNGPGNAVYRVAATIPNVIAVATTLLVGP